MTYTELLQITADQGADIFFQADRRFARIVKRGQPTINYRAAQVIVDDWGMGYLNELI